MPAPGPPKATRLESFLCSVVASLAKRGAGGIGRRSALRHGDEFDAVAGGAEDVDGAVALGVEAGLVGEETDAEVASVTGGEVFEGSEVGGFEDVDAG